jgi:hypothetical protein
MKAFWCFLLGAACGGAVLMMLPKAGAHLQAASHPLHGNAAQSGRSLRAHTEENFVFTAHAPMEQVAPLFGAYKERVWSPQWDPQFIYPLPAADAQGMVFTVAHHHLHSVWVNSELNLKNGRVQYVYVIPDALVTVVTLNLKPEGNQTLVEVHYDRTALTPEADAQVSEMARQDHDSGPEWQTQINQYLEKHKGS